MKPKIILASVAAVVSTGLLIFLTQLESPKPEITPTQTPELTAAAIPEAALATEDPGALQTDSTETPAGNLFAKQEETWRRADPETIFGRFVGWSDRYNAAVTPGEKRGLEAEGLELAKERRGAMKAMIQADPEKAFDLAVPYSVRENVPASIASQFEERLSGYGDLNVLGVLAEPGKENQLAPIIRTAVLDSRNFNAFVYGRRLDDPTLQNTALQGLALDNVIALSENPVRILEPAEARQAKISSLAKEAFCAVSKKPATATGQEIAIEVGGQTQFVCELIHAKMLNDQLIAAARQSTATTQSGTIAGSSYTEGQKRLLLIRVDFPDLAGAPMSDAQGSNIIVGMNSFYSEMSYSRASFAAQGSGSDVTPTFRMPNNASWYGTNNYYDQLRADARSAAAAAGYAQANYEFDITCIGAVPGFGWSGLGYVGAPGAWIRSAFSSAGVTAHEVGHNYGLNHANFWDTSGQSIIGPGTSIEYGDSYDTMGSANAGSYHFNSRYKNYLNWLRTNEIATYTTNGIYRIYTHDNASSPGNRGLKIVRNVNTNYWVEFRQKFTGNKWLMNGAGLRWTQNSNQKSHLLDYTPGTSDGKNDASIPIGRTFADTESGIYITAVGKGGTVPESLDVAVYKGTFSSNLPPTITVSASSTTAATGSPVSFSSSASDPNGDALIYFWDFGDGNFTNGPTATKSWPSVGEYVVRCITSDFRGGVASDSVIVTVGSPTTFRISGQVMNGGNPVEGVRVYVSSKSTYTDSDGTYNLVGLTSGSYTVAASLYGYSFLPNGFSNPVSVGPSKTGIDFADSFVELPPQITSQPQSQTVNLGGAAIFSVTANGTNLRYQWRFNSSDVGGATNSTYLLSNIQGANAGSYSVVVTNSGGGVTSSSAVLAVTDLPSLAGIPNATVDELSMLSFTASASGNYPPFTYSLTAAPAGTSIDPNTGAFSWTPTEAQGPGTYSISVRVTDSNSPAGTDTKTFTATVREVNQAPTLTLPNTTFTVKQGVALQFTATATDPDLPAQTKTFSLVNAPTGATINSSTGLFKWTPKKNQVGTKTMTVKVTDNGSPALNDSKNITVTVTK